MNSRQVDPVFLGLTRPAMLFGVTHSFFVLNAVIGMVGFLATGSFYPLLLGGPFLHGLGFLVCLRDPRTFDIWFVKARFVKGRNRSFWRANSYEPFL